MNFPIEDRLLTYLQGKISFNEWLEGATTLTENGIPLENSSSQQISFYHPEDTISTSQSTRTSESQGFDDGATNLLEKSADIASIIPNRTGKTFESDEGRRTGNDSDASDIAEDFDDDYEEHFNESEVDESIEGAAFA